MGFLSEAFRKPSPLAEDPHMASACARYAAGNERLSPAEQVDMYRRQYWLRHLDSLLEDYPGVQYILGEEEFDRFCRAYLGAHPPRSYTLRDLGNDIVAFAEHFPFQGVSADQKEAALEMIRYENRVAQIFDGPDAAPLDAAALQALPPDTWEKARILLHPLLTLMRVHFRVPWIRAELREQRKPALERIDEAVNLLIYRVDHQIHYDEVSAHAFELLSALAQGKPLVEACDHVLSQAGESEAARVSAEVGTWFQSWAQRGFFVGITRIGGAAGSESL